MCGTSDTCGGQATPVGDKRHLRRTSDTYRGQATLTEDKRCFGRTSDTYGGQATLTEDKRYFRRTSDTCGGQATLVEDKRHLRTSISLRGPQKTSYLPWQRSQGTRKDKQHHSGNRGFFHFSPVNQGKGKSVYFFLSSKYEANRSRRSKVSPFLKVWTTTTTPTRLEL